MKKEQSFFRGFFELLEFLVIVLAIVLPIRLFIAEPFIVSGASMEPTFSSGEYIIVDRLTYRFDDPERGDVVVFKYPAGVDVSDAQEFLGISINGGENKKFFIKRIIGLPGETIEEQSGVLTIKNEESPEGFVLEEDYVRQIKRGNFSQTLSNDEYFVMGDNRPASFDSRSWGALPEENLVGRALLRLFPIQRIDLYPGALEL